MGMKEVGGRNHRLPAADVVHGRVVAAGVAHQQLLVVGWAMLVCSIWSSTAGAILQPQPAPWLYWVSLNSVVGVISKEVASAVRTTKVRKEFWSSRMLAKDGLKVEASNCQYALLTRRTCLGIQTPVMLSAVEASLPRK
jgi:hypothetical protein